MVADCLSRPHAEVNAIYEKSNGIDLSRMAIEQVSDSSISNLLDGEHSLQIVKRPVSRNSNAMILSDCYTGQYRPLVPELHWRKVFDVLRGLSHPRIKGPQKLIASRFVWPHMKVDIRGMVRACIACQQSKISKHNRAPSQKFKAPDGRFESIPVDNVGPLEVSLGYNYLLTVIDRFSRQFEAIPMQEVTAKSCTDNFLLHWVARCGCPKTITSNRGRQFTSQLWHDFANFLGAELIHTTSYYPKANGFVERFHRSLKASLRAQTSSTNWFSNIGNVLLGLRAVHREKVDCSVSEMTLSCALRFPGEFFGENERDDEVTRTPYRSESTKNLKNLKPILPKDRNSRKIYLDNK